MVPVHLYIHIPFCRKRCAYCDFTSYAGQEDRLDAYVAALCAELDMLPSPTVATAALRPTIFLGGGTPSLLSLNQIERILQAARPLVVLEGAEVTVEANPGTLMGHSTHKTDAYEYFCGLRSLGVNRLSLGVQSLHDPTLQLLGRIHTTAEAETCVASASRAGFAHINVDLIFGVPGQTTESWVAQLHTITQWASCWNIDHYSCYSLILEEHTLLYDQVERGEICLPDEDTTATMYDIAIEHFAATGYTHYEISNWARAASSKATNKGAASGEQSDDSRCHHNLAYWLNDDYLGVGAGAHGHISPQRYANIGTIGEYLATVQAGQRPVDIVTPLTLANRCAETMFMGLRMHSGVRFAHFRQRCGVDMDRVYGKTLAMLQREGLLVRTAEAVSLTPRGRRLGNRVFEHFI